MVKVFDRLFFIGPLGLGDTFVHSGIAHWFGDRCVELHLPCWPILYDTVSCLYQDHPHIKVVPLKHYDLGENQYVYENRLSRVLATDFARTEIDGVPLAPLWDVQIYANYGLPFSLRYDNFRFPKTIEGSQDLYEKLSSGQPYILIHRASSQYPGGIPINIEEFRRQNNLPDIKIIEVKEGITTNMMQFVDLIRNAQEIHCVASSFHCLVDSMHNQTDAQLFFHDIRKNAIMKVNSQDNNRRWTVVNYTRKI